MTRRCSKCRNQGHNSRTCPTRVDGENSGVFGGEVRLIGPPATSLMTLPHTSQLIVAYEERKVFAEGDEIEVCSKQEGFKGSYFEATVVSVLNHNSVYKVQYKNLVDEQDQTQPLVEVVSADEVRPAPPPTTTIGATRVFNFLETVDAFDNDGWWVGKISRRKGTKEYWVYFDTYGVEIAYPVSQLRKHLEWRNNRWVSCNKSFF